MPLPVARKRGYRFGVFELDVESQELRKHGVRLRLSGQPFQLLVQLLEKRGGVVSREELRQALWPDQAFGDHDQRLNKAINRVREVLTDSAETPRFIETLPRLGYRFLFPVEALDPASEPVEPAPAPALQETPAAPSRPSAAPRAIDYRRLGASLLALAGAAAGVWWMAHRPASDGPLIPATLTTYVGQEQAPSFAPNSRDVVFAWEGEAQDNFDLYVARAGEGGARRLTRDPRRDSQPAWSPDGKRIAFRRETETASEIWVISESGQDERRLVGTSRTMSQNPLAWTPDSRAIVFADVYSDGQSAIYLYFVSTGEKRRLTSPPAGVRTGDLSPAVAPNGSRLAFTRDTGGMWRDLFVADLTGEFRIAREPVRLTDLHQRVDTAAWTPGADELVFGAAAVAGGVNYLYRIGVDDRRPRDLGSVRTQGSNPVISPDGRTLAFAVRAVEQSSIWRLDLDPKPKPTRLISSTSRDFSPDVSPDGRRVVMSSIRSGSPQLWLFNIDGTDPRQITKSVGNAGASIPRWSPDGKQIVFDSRPGGPSLLFLFELETGNIRPVKTGLAQESRGSFSRDGRWIYFSSDQYGKPQLYRFPSAGGGRPEQLTRNGGAYALESLDRKWIYYTSSPLTGGAIRRMPIQGGEEVDLATNVIAGSSLAITESGLYYMSAAGPSGTSTLYRYLFATGRSEPIFRPEKPVHNALTVSPDGGFLLFTQSDRVESDLMIVRDFR